MRANDMYEACADALRAYAEGAGFTDMVVGLSGGIDSSVIAVLCADVFGPDHVHGVMLPGPYSTEHSLDDARELADNLGIETHVVSICEPFEAFEAVLRRSGCGKLSGTASENTQARCRTVVLMALSNANGWMLVNTGNRSESMMGYSTLYGDTAGAFAPIGGLYKTDVYAIARWRNERAERDGQVPPIPEHVLVKPPSAELAPGQEDEKSMGIHARPHAHRAFRARGQRERPGGGRVQPRRRRARAGEGALAGLQARPRAAVSHCEVLRIGKRLRAPHIEKM